MSKSAFSLALCALSLFFSVTAAHAAQGAVIERKFASTRMPGCAQNDIIHTRSQVTVDAALMYGADPATVRKTFVWASCNSAYELPGSSYYPGIQSGALDLNGWPYGRLYEVTNAACPSGYRIPTLQEMFYDFENPDFDDVLMMPAGGAYAEQVEPANHYDYKDRRGYYLTTETYFGKMLVFDRATHKPPYDWFFGVRIYADDRIPKGSLRCMRVLPPTAVELHGSLAVAESSAPSGSQFSTAVSGSQNLAPSTGYRSESFSSAGASQDPYVNEKLGEIRACFARTYQTHLDAIDAALVKLNEEKAKQTDQKTAAKFQAAIGKVGEIRSRFLVSYASLATGALAARSSAAASTAATATSASATGAALRDVLSDGGYSYRFRLDPRNANHVLATLLVMADLRARGYGTDELYWNLDELFLARTGKSFESLAAAVLAKTSSKALADKLRDVKVALEGDESGRRGILDGFGFEVGDGLGNKEVGLGSVMGSGPGTGLADVVSGITEAIESGRNGFGDWSSKGGGFNDTYGGGAGGFNDPRGRNMAGGFDEVVGFGSHKKRSNADGFNQQNFQYWAVNGADGSFRQGSKTSRQDANGNNTSRERFQSNNTDGSYEAYEGTTDAAGNRQGTYTKTDKDGNVVERKSVGGAAPKSDGSDGAAPEDGAAPDDDDTPTGSVNPEKDRSGASPATFIALMGWMGKSAWAGGFNSPSGALDWGRDGGDNAGGGGGGPVNEFKVGGSGVIDWGMDSCAACHMGGGINKGAYKAGQVTNPGGR